MENPYGSRLEGFFYAIYSLNNLTFRPIPFFPFASFPFHSLRIRKTSVTCFTDSTQILTLQTIFRQIKEVVILFSLSLSWFYGRTRHTESGKAFKILFLTPKFAKFNYVGIIGNKCLRSAVYFFVVGRNYISIERGLLFHIST